MAAAAKLLLRGGGAPLRGDPSDKGAAGPGIAAVMAGMEGITLVLAAVLAIGMVASQASMPPGAAVAMLTLPHWGRWLPR